MTLEELMKIAEYANKRARELVPYSSNRPNRYDQPFHRALLLMAMRLRGHPVRNAIQQWSLDISEDKVDDDYAERRVHFSFDGYSKPTLEECAKHLELLPDRVDKTHHKDGTKVTILEKIEASAKNAVKFGIGNCCEYAAIAFSLLVEYPEEGLSELGLPPISKTNTLIERISIPGRGDHAFIVLNRGKESKLTDISTWSDKTIIIDPWYNEVVHVASYLKKKLTSKCLDYISQYQAKFNCYYEAHLSQGHSSRWKKHRTAKNEPSELRNWATMYPCMEKVPWVESKDSEDITISKNRKRKFDAMN